MNATMNATLNGIRDWLTIAEDAITTNTPRVFNAAMREIATRALAAAMHAEPRVPLAGFHVGLETAFRSAAGLGDVVTNLPLTSDEPSPSLQVSESR